MRRRHAGQASWSFSPSISWLWIFSLWIFSLWPWLTPFKLKNRAYARWLQRASILIRSSAGLLASGVAMYAALTVRRQALHQPGCRRPRRRIAAIGGVKAILRIVPGIDGEPDQPSALDVVRYHRFGHRAPAKSGKQKRMFGAQIGQPPAFHRHHAEIAILGQR